MPTLYTALTSGENATNASIYGSRTNSFVLEKDDIVQIIVNNEHMGRHPFHLHGHQFQVVYQSQHRDPLYKNSGLTETDLPRTPIRRDTVTVIPGGSIVIRFRADNPGASPSLGNFYHSDDKTNPSIHQESGYSTATWNGTLIQASSPQWWKHLLHSRSR